MWYHRVPEAHDAITVRTEEAIDENRMPMCQRTTRKRHHEQLEKDDETGQFRRVRLRHWTHKASNFSQKSPWQCRQCYLEHSMLPAPGKCDRCAHGRCMKCRNMPVACEDHRGFSSFTSQGSYPENQQRIIQPPGRLEESTGCFRPGTSFGLPSLQKMPTGGSRNISKSAQNPGEG